MKKSVIIAIVAILLVIVVIVVGVIFGLQMAKGNAKDGDVKQKEIYQHDVGEMHSNLSESKKLVKVTPTVETTDEKYIETLENKNYIIRNEINEIIRSKKEEDIRGIDAQKNIQKQIVTRLNEIFDTEVISDVYFNDFIVQ